MKQIPRTVFLVASLFLLLIGFSSCDVEQKKFSVTYESEHGNVPDAIEVEINTILTADQLPVLEEEGYTFLFWKEGFTKVEAGKYKVTKDIVLSARWEKNPEEPILDATYKVEHYQESLENEYTLIEDDTEEKKGIIGEKTAAEAKTYEGFIEKEIDQETIKADGSTVVEIYYKRKEITLSFYSDEETIEDSISGKYGAKVSAPKNPSKSGFYFAGWEPELPKTFPAEDATYKAMWSEIKIYKITYDLDGGEIKEENPTEYTEKTLTIKLKEPKKQGYTFLCWKDSEENEYTKITKGTTGDISLKAYWKPNENTAYKEEIYLQEIEEDEYFWWKTNEKEGTTGEKTSVEAEIKEGFTALEIEQKEIAADGSTVVKIYYERNTSTLTFDTEGGTEIEPITGKYKLSFELENPIKQGYSFMGWEPALPETIPAESTTYKAIWEPNKFSISVIVPSRTEILDMEEPIVEGTKVTFTAPGSYAKYMWYLDGQKQQFQEKTTWTLDTSDLQEGSHLVMLVAMDRAYNFYSTQYELEVSK